MPLTLILGRVGCGKTAYMAEEIGRLIDGGETGVTLLVPDQYTVASEQFFLSRLGAKRFRHLNVTSLKSLARTQFIAHGIPHLFLGEGGKTVLLKKAFDAVAPSFRHYPPEYRNPRFLHLLSGAIKELKAAGISAEDLMEAARKHGNDKLYDLASVRQVYEGYLNEGFFDPDDAPSRLCKLLEETGEFEDRAVFVANFRTFYNRERNILLQMVRNGARVTVALPSHTTDPAAAGATADSAEEARKLVAYCRRMGEECRIVNLQSQASFPSEEFRLLEESLAVGGGESVNKTPEHLHLFCGADRFDEAEQAAATIARLVREEGYRYSDFTVIVRSLEDYAGILDPIFDQYEIPLFYHRKTPLRQRSPMPLIVALFSMASEGFSSEAVLSFVKSGFCASPEAVSAFERYVNVWNVRYNRFLMPFTRPIGGFTANETEEDKALRIAAEQVRQTVADIVLFFRERAQNATVRETSTALFEVLERLHVAETLEKHAEEYRAFGEYELAARQRKVYEQLMLVLDELVLTAGDDVLPLKEYRDLFYAVTDTHDVAILPTSLDEVTAGSPETLPMISPRCVFVLGLNEGIFPRTVDDNRLLTDKDRALLSDFGIGETTDDKILHELFYLYLSLTAPRETLYLSYSSMVGGEAAPSRVISQIKEWFPALTEERFRVGDPACLSLRIQRERAAFALHTKTAVRELGDWFTDSAEYGPVLSRRQSVAALNEETAARLYPENLFVSASRADRYHQCAYAYFFNYGLGIVPQRKAELDAAQLGTLIHDALEKCISQGLDCSDEELRARVQAFGKERLLQFYGEETPPDNMLSYFEALLKKIERLLFLFRKEFAVSQFVPVAFEQVIGNGNNAVAPVKIPLERGSLSMIGIVDRVDVFEQKGVKYLRVIDYKSGTKEFSFEKIQNGIDIQMLMYLYALRQNLYPGEECLPAGVQYIGANPKVASASHGEDPEAVLVQWEQNTPRSGVYLKDNGVLYAMDNTPDRKFLRIKKPDSKFFITVNRFGELFEEISALLKKMGDSLHQGKIEKNPIRIPGSYCSCDFCDLRDTCRHPDPRNVFAKNPAEEVPCHAPMDE